MDASDDRPDPAEPALAERIARAITLAGPISIAQYMGAANAHYYATRDPLGARGDFTTAPEISQMFGEMIGLALADCWMRAGRPRAHYVELGPGRGTLARDALRAMRTAGLDPQVHFVETSPVLRAAQAEAVPEAEFHVDPVGLPDDAALLIVANEFFDALPIRQLVRLEEGWVERLVACQDTLFLPVAGKTGFDPVVPQHLRGAAPGSILETSPAGVATMRALAQRLVAQGGCALMVDYGYEGPAIGDTLQAVSGHDYANPFEAPGTRDITAHVDFATLIDAARVEDAQAFGPVTQRDLLGRLGLDSRATSLAAQHPERADALLGERNRLMGEDEMGHLFKAIAVTGGGWPEPEGFR